MYVAAEEFLKLGKCLRCSHRGSCHNQRLLTQRFCCSSRCVSDTIYITLYICRPLPGSLHLPRTHVAAVLRLPFVFQATVMIFRTVPNTQTQRNKQKLIALDI
ncbi:hypothetical protein J6590_089697 [Homalodisca vitripennis]|nr:hypothetical protein J6590_089697 [Homalodisca vitripennis]